MVWAIWKRRRAGVVGVDWTGQSVRLVQLDRQRGQVLRVAERRLAECSSGPEDGDENMGTYARLLRQLWRESGFAGRDVCLCLQPGELYLQNIRVSQDVADVDAAVCNEVANRLPVPLDQVEMRYLVAGSVRQGESQRQEVIVFSCRREVIERKLALLEAAGLRCQGIDVHPAALLRCYRAQLRRESDRVTPLALVSIHDSGTVLVVGTRDQPFFVKGFDLTPRHFDETVSRALGLPLEEAALLRRHQGDRRQEGRDPELVAAMRQAVCGPLAKLAAEIAMCLRYCTVTFRNQPIREVVLSGVEATPDHAELLAEHLGITVRCGNPFLPFRHQLRGDGHGRWDIAVGLALWEATE